jgi:uncharacterized protein (UPF0335 family)
VPDDATYRVTAQELRAFIERAERLEAEKAEIAELLKEVFAEAKARGYDVKILKKVMALRKRDPNDIAEEEAVLDMYREALGLDVGTSLRDLLPQDGGGDAEEEDFDDLI